MKYCDSDLLSFSLLKCEMLFYSPTGQRAPQREMRGAAAGLDFGLVFSSDG